MQSVNLGKLKTMKRCTRCKKWKELKEFGKDSQKSDGLRCWCKLCQKNYYQDNQERILKHKKEYNLKNKEKIDNKNKKYHRKYPWKRIYNAIKQRCNNPKTINYRWYGEKGIENHFKNADDVKYLWFRDKAYLMKKPSIDREDNDGHYCIGNCKFIELSENVIKRNRENPPGRPILQYDRQGNFIKEWESQIEASRQLKINRGHISTCASGKLKTSGGYIWEYKEDKK